MVAKGKERIFRLAVSALISSPLSSAELRKLVEYLDSDPSFRYELFDVLIGITRSAQDRTQPEIEWAESTPHAAGADGLLELVVDILSRKRYPKRELRSLLGALNPSLMRTTSEDMTTRELVELFLSGSSTKARKALLRELGLDVEEDLYLGGISSRRVE